MYRAGFTHKEIAADIEASQEAIRQVLLGRTWAHVSDPVGPIVMRRRGAEPGAGPTVKLDWEAAVAIRACHSRGRSHKELAQEFGCSQTTVRDIVNWRTWKG